MQRRVFIVQEPVKRDSETGELVPMMNFKRVLEYGSPIVCLPRGNVALSPAPTMDKLREKLKDFSDKDYLVCAGDPTCLAMAAIIAADRNRGKVTMLKWDKISKGYIEVRIDLYNRKES